MPARAKKARFDSDRNCSHCLLFRNTFKHLEDGTILWGRCLKNRGKEEDYISPSADLLPTFGIGCEDFTKDPKNPIPKREWTEEELEAQKFLRKRMREKGDRTRTSLKAYRKKEYSKLKIKSPLIDSKKKQQRQLEILSDNKEATQLLNLLFPLKKRSSKAGRKLRRQLRKSGFYLSRKNESLKVQRPKLPEVKRPKEKIEILELTPQRKKEFQRAGIVHIDTTLLRQCAYYPRPKGAFKPSKCTECSFNLPNPDCDHSHILIDTRIKKRGSINDRKTN